MSDIEFRTILPNEPFDPLTISGDAPFTQERMYGEWQESLGRTTFRFVATKDGKPVAYVQLIEYPLIGDKKYLYAPYGPVVSEFSNEVLAAFKEKLIAVARDRNAVFVRLDFTPAVHDYNKIAQLNEFFKHAPSYTYHSAYFQPRAEWFLELKKSEEDLLMGMDIDNRYSIRVAGKKNITTEIITHNCAEYFPVFYELMSITADRNGFSLHPREYYKNIFDQLSTSKNSYIVVTRYEQRILVIKVVIVYGGIANDIFTGSSTEERNRRPSYMAVWKAISYAKQIGCSHYNFGGITTADHPHKGWKGLTSFKQKFGGYEFRHSDFYDIVTESFWYYLYNLRKLIKRFI